MTFRPDLQRLGAKNPNGGLHGRDCRDMTREELEGEGYVLQPMKAIRRKCLDCCSGSHLEVTHCPVVSCPLWALRFGKRPKSGNESSNEDGATPLEEIEE